MSESIIGRNILAFKPLQLSSCAVLSLRAWVPALCARFEFQTDCFVAGPP